MRTQLRIVAGELRGRKIVCTVNPELRPTPQMVREALFSILGNAVPDRTFIDIFAGTGINGLEALSRGASSALWIERDFHLAQEIEKYVNAFDLAERGKILRTDAYRWAEYWQPQGAPVNLFLSPPFADLKQRIEEFVTLVRTLQQRMPTDSVLVVQAEKVTALDRLPDLEHCDIRQYGRNMLLFWVKEEATAT